NAIPRLLAARGGRATTSCRLPQDNPIHCDYTGMEWLSPIFMTEPNFPIRELTRQQPRHELLYRSLLSNVAMRAMQAPE
ncbi:MAG: hypothetical protein V3R53_00730, partial [Gammaproteobacteria bacterium]